MGSRVRSLRLSEELWDVIKCRAKELGVSVNKLCANALDNYCVYGNFSIEEITDKLHKHIVGSCGTIKESGCSNAKED